MMKSIIKVRIEGKELHIDSRFQRVSGLLKELLQQGDEDEIFDLSPEFIKLQQFTIISKYYESHNFQPKIIKITSDDPQQVLCQSDFDLIMKYSPFDGKALLQLIQASIYLNLKHFKNLCLIRIAIEIYIDPQNSYVSIEKLSKKYPNISSITMQDLDNYRKNASFLFDNYI